jgi:phage gpG-like protein
MPAIAAPAPAGDDPERKLERIYQAVADAVTNFEGSDVLQDEIVPLLAHVHEDYFNQQAGPDGPWAALAPSTVNRKGHDTILIDTGTMRSSLLFEGGDHIQDVGADFLTWGTDDPKSYFHQMGTSRIPARPFVGLKDGDIDQIAEKIADAVQDAVVQAIDKEIGNG